MFRIDPNTSRINITRGDIGTIELTIKKDDGTSYVFQDSDVVRFSVYEIKDFNGEPVLLKNVIPEEDSTSVDIELLQDDTTIGELINKPVTYWYEIQLNPDTAPQTIIGYDQYGAKEFILYPEGGKYDN